MTNLSFLPSDTLQNVPHVIPIPVLRWENKCNTNFHTYNISEYHTDAMYDCVELHM